MTPILSLTASGPSDYKKLIYTQLACVGGNCITPSFEAQIDLQWRILASQAANDLELHYYLTKAEMLKVLMICAARSVDTVSSSITDNTFGNSRMRASGQAQAAGSNSNVSFQDLLGKQRYSDLTTGNRTLGSNRAGFSRSRNQIWTDFDDDGRGARFTQNYGAAANTGFNRSVASDNAYELGLGTERRRGCSYQFNWTEKSGKILTPVVATFTRTAARNSWGLRTFQTSNSEHSDQARSVGTTETHGGKDRVRNTWNKASSWSNALANTITQGVQALENYDTLLSQRDSRSSGAGSGFEQSEGRGRGNGRVAFDATSHDEMQSRASQHEAGQTHRDSLKQSQLYKNLEQLYKHTLELIQHRISEIAASQVAFCDMAPVCIPHRGQYAW